MPLTNCQQLPTTTPSLLHIVSTAIHRTLTDEEVRLLLLLSPHGVAKLNHELIREHPIDDCAVTAADSNHESVKADAPSPPPAHPVERCLCELAAVYAEVARRREMAKQRLAENPTALRIAHTMKAVPTTDEMICMSTFPVALLREMIEDRQRNGDNLDDAIEDLAWEHQQRQLMLEAERLAVQFHKDVTTSPLGVVSLNSEKSNDHDGVSSSSVQRRSANSAQFVFMATHLDDRRVKIGLAPVHGWFYERWFDLSTADLFARFASGGGDGGAPHTQNAPQLSNDQNDKSKPEDNKIEEEEEEEDENQLRLMSFKSIDTTTVSPIPPAHQLPSPSAATERFSRRPRPPPLPVGSMVSDGRRVAFRFSASQEELMKTNSGESDPPHVPLQSPTPKHGRRAIPQLGENKETDSDNEAEEDSFSDANVPAAFQCFGLSDSQRKSKPAASGMLGKALDRIFSSFRRLHTQHVNARADKNVTTFFKNHSPMASFSALPSSPKLHRRNAGVAVVA